jgi:hypothetical protein
LNKRGPIDELLDRDHHTNYVLVSGRTEARITAEHIAPALLWPPSPRLRAGDPRHSWPKTAKLAAMPVTIGLCGHR